MIRCELSLDSGETWRRAEIERNETPTPHNKTWCWVFWSVAVSAVELLRAPELRIRAVDSSQNMMPEKCALSMKSCCRAGLLVKWARSACGLFLIFFLFLQLHTMHLGAHVLWQGQHRRLGALIQGHLSLVQHTCV